MRGVTGYLLAACCVLLVGCGGAKKAGAPPDSAVTPVASSQPSVAPTTPIGSATATASPTGTTPLLTGAAVKPGELPPEYPSFEQTDTQIGAFYFTAYFYKALDWSIATTNPNLLRPISAPECKPCQHYIQGLDALAAAGGHSEGGRIMPDATAIGYGDLAKSDFVFKVTFDQQVEVVVSPGAGPATYSPPITPTVNYLYIDWRAGHWVAVEIGGP